MRSTQIDLDPLTVYNLFKLIPEEDIVFLNMDAAISKPIEMLITTLPVPPGCIRPTVPMAGGLTNEDDLTVSLEVIIQNNKEI